MKLTNIFNAAGERVLALVEGDRVYDLSKASGNKAEFASLGKWLHGGESARAQADKLREQLAGDGSAGKPLSEAKLAPMVDCDARIFCVGLNYADHAAENNLPPPTSPIFFAKLAAVVIPHLAPIPKPTVTQQLDYEAEFAVVIGRRADRVSEDAAKSCVAGFSIMNDVTARDL